MHLALEKCAAKVGLLLPSRQSAGVVQAAGTQLADDDVVE
jgi:hypothetical protein